MGVFLAVSGVAFGRLSEFRARLGGEGGGQGGGHHGRVWGLGFGV